MALKSTPSVDTAALAAWWQAPTDWYGAVAENLWAIQRAQWATLAAWQQAMTASQQEWWSEWASQWAGGAPIGD